MVTEAPLGGCGQHRIGCESGWGRDCHVHPGGDPAEHQRMRHVVGAVTEVRHPQTAQCSLALGDGLQVGQHLAGVELVGKRVDDRH
jgi:hypothetical protein